MPPIPPIWPPADAPAAMAHSSTVHATAFRSIRRILPLRTSRTTKKRPARVDANGAFLK
jgi:hypothetical protein